MGLAITAMGAAALLTFKKMVKQYVEVGDMVHKMAIRTGFAAETLSELAYAADISGADLTMLEKGVKKMSKTIVDASYGLETYLRVFRSLGIEIEDIMKLSPEEQFLTLGAAISKMENQTLKTAAAVDIFGRAGTMLLPLFAEGAEGMAKLREEAHTLGIIFDEEAATKAAKLKDAQTALKGSVQGLSIAILNDLIPILTDVTKGFTDFFVTSRKDAGNWTNALLGFFKIVAKGVEALALAWHGMQVIVFKGAEFIIKAIKLQVDTLLLPIRLLAKLPGYGILAKKMLKMVGEHTADLTTISEGYNEAAAEQIEKITNLVFDFAKFYAVLDKVKTKTKEVKEEDKSLGKTIEKDLTLKARELYGALDHVVESFTKVRYYGTEAADDVADTWEETFWKVLGAASLFTSSLGSLFDQLTTNQMANIDKEYEARKAAIENSLMTEKSKADAMEKLDAATEKKRKKAERAAAKRTKAVSLMEAIVNTAAGVAQALKAPFPLSLILPGIIGAMGAVQIALIAAQPLPSFQRGGRIEEAGIVGERGPELFVPGTPGEIFPLRERATPLGPQIVLSFNPAFYLSSLDPQTARDVVRDQVGPELLEMLKTKILLPEFQDALRIK
ncbi:MAG: hypothetical protein KAV87_54260 [Desulfobacteraceae bacterium]|nr:hypothetical protein [Desulfobacteraceae bacterium]